MLSLEKTQKECGKRTTVFKISEERLL